MGSSEVGQTKQEKLVGAVGIELSQEFSKSGVFTVLRRFPRDEKTGVRLTRLKVSTLLRHPLHC
jgi:hypothetical protein